MSVISYMELVSLVKQGIINAPMENINGASIDITLGDEVLIETPVPSLQRSVDLKSQESLNMKKLLIPDSGLQLHAGQFILASSVETFNLPNNLACEYKLKSSLARSGLQHMLAGWCDPGWTDSKLTLELKNVTQFHTLILKAGMKIGQIVFFHCKRVPVDQSYAVKGQYNGQKTVTENKGVR